MSRPFNSPDVFRAIADPTRRKMLDLLRVSDRTPAEILTHFRLGNAAISHHLKALRMAGLIRQRRVGVTRLYTLCRNPLARVEGWINSYARKAGRRAV